MGGGGDSLPLCVAAGPDCCAPVFSVGEHSSKCRCIKRVGAQERFQGGSVFFLAVGHCLLVFTARPFGTAIVGLAVCPLRISRDSDV